MLFLFMVFAWYQRNYDCVKDSTKCTDESSKASSNVRKQESEETYRICANIFKKVFVEIGEIANSSTRHRNFSIHFRERLVKMVH